MRFLSILILMLATISGVSQEIVHSPVPAPEPTETEALLTVIVQNDKKLPQEGEAVSFVAKKTGQIFSGTTGADGKFQVLIPEGDSYAVKYLRFAEQQKYEDLDVPSMDGIIEFDYTITVQEIVKTYTLNNVHFDNNKSSLRADSYPELNNLADFLLNKKNIRIEIAGHTDNVGEDAANLKLSQDRAETVRNYLIKKGVAADRITAKGYGETLPVAGNDTDDGRAKNRRTEVKIL